MPRVDISTTIRNMTTKFGQQAQIEELTLSQPVTSSHYDRRTNVLKMLQTPFNKGYRVTKFGQHGH